MSNTMAKRPTSAQGKPVLLWDSKDSKIMPVSRRGVRPKHIRFYRKVLEQAAGRRMAS